MSDRLALANAIEEAGIERSKAERVASVIVAAIYDHAATKTDVQASETAVRADVAQLSATTRGDLTTLRGDLGRAGSAAQADLRALGGELRAEIATTRSELRAEISGVRTLLAAETARLDTRIERLDATVKAQPNAIMLRLGTLMVVLTGIILAALRYFPPPPGHG
jgi:hypothetical protein